MSNVNSNAEYENNINNVNDVGYRAILSNKKTFVELLRTFVKKDWVNQVDDPIWSGLTAPISSRTSVKRNRTLSIN